MPRHHRALFPPPPPHTPPHAPHAARDVGSPEPLRVRSPESLQRLGKRQRENDDDVKGDDDDDETIDVEEATGSRRFNHEPWDWKLQRKGEQEKAEAEVNDDAAVADCDDDVDGKKSVAEVDLEEEEEAAPDDDDEATSPPPALKPSHAQQHSASESLVA